MAKKEVMYMKVSADEYELPIDFEMDYKVLAAKNNMKPSTLLSDISKATKIKNPGKKLGHKFIRILL